MEELENREQDSKSDALDRREYADIGKEEKVKHKGIILTWVLSIIM